MEQCFLLKKELIDKIVEITGVDYYGKLDLGDIVNIIKDLINEYHILEEKYNDKVEYCKEWHEEKKVNYSDLGISESDFQ